MNNLRPILAASMLCLISACSSTSETIAQQEQRNQVLNNRFSEAQTLVDQIAARIKQAQSDSIGYFAPDNLEEAKEHYQDAQENFDEILADKTEATQRKTNRIKKYVADANAQLDAAYVTKSNAETILVDSFDIRDQLNKLNASKVLPKTYKSLMKEIDDIVEEVADGDLEDAREENADLLPKLRAFEIRIVKLVELKSVNADMAYLKKVKASRNAPITFKKALAALQNAESTIAMDPRDQVKIKKVVADADFAIKHTRQMMQAVTELASIKRSERENYLMQFENQLLSLSQSLAGKDFRNLSFNEQGKQILQLIDGNKQEVDSLRSHIAALQSGIVEGDKKGAAQLALAKQEQVGLQGQLAEKDKLLAAQGDSMNALQLRLDEANKQLLERQRVELEKDKQLLTLEKSNLALNSQVSQLQAQIVALAQPAEALQPKTPPVAEDAAPKAAESAPAPEKIEETTQPTVEATADDKPADTKVD